VHCALCLYGTSASLLSIRLFPTRRRQLHFTVTCPCSKIARAHVTVKCSWRLRVGSNLIERSTADIPYRQRAQCTHYYLPQPWSNLTHPHFLQAPATSLMPLHTQACNMLYTHAHMRTHTHHFSCILPVGSVRWRRGPPWNWWCACPWLPL